MGTLFKQTEPALRTWSAKAAALIAAARVLAACATGPTYRPRGPNEAVGYSDLRLTENRFRVTFTGGVNTRREQVEDYLMRRAAEVTLEAGYTHFVFDARDTEARTYYPPSMIGPRMRFGFGAGPRHYGPRWWYYSSFAFGDPFYDPFYDRDFAPTTRYQAYSEIVTLRPEQAANEPEAMDARRLLAQLAPPPPPPPPN